MDKCYIKNPQYKVRSFNGKKYLFGENKAFLINETAVVIWDSLSTSNNTSAVLEMLKKKYTNIKSEILEKDLNNFLGFLVEKNALFEY